MSHIRKITHKKSAETKKVHPINRSKKEFLIYQEFQKLLAILNLKKLLNSDYQKKMTQTSLTLRYS